MGGVSHGFVAFHLAVGLGMVPDDAREAAEMLDVMQPSWDLADNLVDVELDRALGRDPDARYRGIPRESLPFLPALLLASAVSGLHSRYPAPTWDPGNASRRLLGALARMNVAQGLPLDHPNRNDDLSGEFGRIVCLPLWLLPRAHTLAPRVDACERWAVLWGRTLQLRWEAQEFPADAHRRDRLERAIQEARVAWPSFPPFVAGGSFACEAVLG